jgi:hypothetical protein
MKSAGMDKQQSNQPENQKRPARLRSALDHGLPLLRQDYHKALSSNQILGLSL